MEWQRGYPKRGRFEIFWDWNRRYADNGLVWRNVDAIIDLGAILFPAVYPEEAGWQPKYPRHTMALLYVRLFSTFIVLNLYYMIYVFE